MNATHPVARLFRAVLHRDPNERERSHLEALAAGPGGLEAVLDRLLQSPEHERIVARLARTFVPPGHFYSPIVDVEQVRQRYGRPQPDIAPEAIRLDPAAMRALWAELLPFLHDIPFPEDPDPAWRYHFRNPAFSYGDGSVLHAMLRRFRPRRMVEVGSGYSSACSVDTIDRFLDGAVELAFVEPYPKLLTDLVGPQRLATCRLHATGVQDADLSIFRQLESGDFLFIDSTHVMKTGSDVCHELFHVLPALQPGVFVHFHDIFWPFEYGPAWIVKENRSWNEIYGLRAFLMYNDAFEIVFFNDWFARHARDLIESGYPATLKNTGGSIWLRKRA